ncbi:hypothetical protein MKK69_07860 [Methylobacterium sp. J-026]|uniref:hypothetical protein n=1 Tax=Methylobacterium sp. J-026 TaxID=2836624 RepID=UPI001FBA5AD2|nr:hypothetical protein [Methylobacterium sp. J-026]MCJ2133984.1 hypothetical protein [Methylobacterium sp. J-026]
MDDEVPDKVSAKMVRAYWKLAAASAGCALHLVPISVATQLTLYPGLIELKNYNARCDGSTNDRDAFAAGIEDYNRAMARGRLAVLRVPAGQCVIDGTTLPSFAPGVGGAVVGEGNWKSVIRLGQHYSGDLFSWSDSWGGRYERRVGHGNIANPQIYGARLSDLTIIGDRSSTKLQNAIMMYDHEDFVTISDIDVQDINGRVFYGGGKKYGPVSYLRESLITRMRIWNSGSQDAPVFEITSECSEQDCSKEDSSNEVILENINIYGSHGTGMVIRNYQSASGGVLRDISLSHVRIEGTEGNPHSTAADEMVIGDPTTDGRIRNVKCSDCELISPYTGYVSLRITGRSPVAAPHNVFWQGVIIAGAGGGGGVSIDAAQKVELDLRELSSRQVNLSVRGREGVRGPIRITGHGEAKFWSWKIDPTARPFIRILDPGDE